MKAILLKLCNIQSEIEKMEKDGRNTFNNYDYLSEAQITFTIKTLFDKYKVLFHYQSEITGVHPYGEGNQFLVTVKIPYAFIDVETGEKLEGIAYGQGSDKGDKGVYKAITGAIKYIYMKTFNIPTGDDAEKDDRLPSVNKEQRIVNPGYAKEVAQSNPTNSRFVRK